ncbi:MAG TPA: hypothetical protein VGG84_07925 [Gemmatimonadaceae bacterium]|jgi:Spy/CpxP family protein refolding chaperone
MTFRLVPIVAVALLAACSHNNPNSTLYPGSASASTSGDGGGRRGPGGRGDEMLLRGITLSSDQQQRVEAIRSRYRSQMEQMRQQSGGDRTAMRDQMRSTMEKQMSEIRAVLTDDQQRQFDQNVAEMRARRGGQR